MVSMSFAKHDPHELAARNITVDLRELEDRMASDSRKPIEVCALKREFGPTPCWWPFCNCGEK